MSLRDDQQECGARHQQDAEQHQPCHHLAIPPPSGSRVRKIVLLQVSVEEELAFRRGGDVDVDHNNAELQTG
jgi:hypothetical protein